jgi:hypothetical protein
MTSPTDLRKEASDRRDLARRVRRMALGLTRTADKERMNLYADELEEQAAELEQQVNQPSPSASAAAPDVTQQQQQTQQQQATEPPADPEKPKS